MPKLGRLRLLVRASRAGRIINDPDDFAFQELCKLGDDLRGAFAKTREQTKHLALRENAIMAKVMANLKVQVSARFDLGRSFYFCVGGASEGARRKAPAGLGSAGRQQPHQIPPARGGEPEAEGGGGRRPRQRVGRVPQAQGESRVGLSGLSPACSICNLIARRGLSSVLNWK